MQRAKLLTLLVEFNPNANDDFSGWSRPDPDNPAECVTEPANTLLNGPLHNQIPDPATIGRGTDNNTFWVPNFNRSFYQKLIYSSNGVQQKIRRTSTAGSTSAAGQSRTTTSRSPRAATSSGAPPRRG